ncbi:uncharacterized protein LOC135828197 isoform X2 [Sycon ciliatum]|uniref:uncharacterized protein LOC135828197 isoform X2 n=1 Tax=Sycon ciliatum TaxID=27933 RepID=UPI0031F638D8
MGYTARHLEMLRVVANPEKELLSRVGQPESANAISTSADPPVTMPTEEGMTTAAASAEYAAYQSTAGATSPSPLVQRFGPLCPPMKSRTAAARPGAEGGEAAGAAAAAATPAAAAGAMAGRVAVASSATILNPQAPHQARLPIGTAMSELAHGATAESELGATAAVPTVPALHHCHYSGAHPPTGIALQPGAALACSSTGRSPSSLSGPSTTAETTFGLSQTCMSASTQATTTHPIASSANTSTGSFTADGNAAGRGTALQQSTQPPASVHLENTAQLAAAAVVRHASSLPLEPQAKRALLNNVGRAFTEEMSRHIDYVSAQSMAHTSPDSQASLLQKSQFLLDSTAKSDGDSGLSGSAGSSDTEEWTKRDLRKARVTVFMDSKLRTSVDDCDGIILDRLSKQHFNETNIRIEPKPRRSDPALTCVEGKAGGQIRTLITIIIKGRYDDSTEHKIERELLGDLEALTYSRHQIQVLFRGPYDSIQVVLLLPMRTLGHLLYLAVHYPGLLRGLDILQIIDISSLTIIDFREITGNSSNSTVALDELTEDNEELSEDNEDDEDEDDVEVLPQSYDNELEFSRRTDVAAAAQPHISQQEYDQINNRSKDFQLVLAVIMRSHRKDQNFLTAIRTCISNGAQQPIGLQPGAALACSSTDRSPSSMSGPSTTAETTFGLSQTCMSASTQATTTHPIASSANTTGRFTADGNAASYARNKAGDTPLHKAAEQGNIDICISLLEAGADKDIQNSAFDTPLHCAAKQCNIDICKTLLDAGAQKSIQNSAGDTPLHCAAKQGNIDICRTLLNAGAEKNIRNSAGDTPLHCAAKQCNIPICKTLLDAGAEKDIQNSAFDTPLHCAAKQCSIDICKTLLDVGAEKNIQNSAFDTPLHCAAKQCNIDICKTLLDVGAEKNIQNSAFDTPLHCAAKQGNIDICKTLLDAGAEKDIRNSAFDSPLHCAAKQGNIDICKTLLDAGAEKDIRNSDGDTPLHNAAMRGTIDVCQALLAAGADCNIRNEDGETPLDKARNNGHRSVEELLKKVTSKSAESHLRDQIKAVTKHSYWRDSTGQGAKQRPVEELLKKVTSESTE